MRPIRPKARGRMAGAHDRVCVADTVPIQPQDRGPDNIIDGHVRLDSSSSIHATDGGARALRGTGEGEGEGSSVCASPLSPPPPSPSPVPRSVGEHCFPCASRHCLPLPPVPGVRRATAPRACRGTLFPVREATLFPVCVATHTACVRESDPICGCIASCVRACAFEYGFALVYRCAGRRTGQQPATRRHCLAAKSSSQTRNSCKPGTGGCGGLVP